MKIGESEGKLVADSAFEGWNAGIRRRQDRPRERACPTR